MWEYQTIYVKHEAPFGNIFGIKLKPINDVMAKMGKEGWELVATTPDMFAGTNKGDLLYFKRPVLQHSSM